MPGLPEPLLGIVCRDVSRETLRLFTLENCRKRRLWQSDSAIKTPHICAGDTLLQRPNCRNRKSMVACAQAVEDRTSLWKLQEKRK
jgi:hypothetical protein